MHSFGAHAPMLHATASTTSKYTHFSSQYLFVFWQYFISFYIALFIYLFSFFIEIFLETIEIEWFLLWGATSLQTDRRFMILNVTEGKRNRKKSWFDSTSQSYDAPVSFSRKTYSNLELLISIRLLCALSQNIQPANNYCHSHTAVFVQKNWKSSRPHAWHTRYAGCLHILQTLSLYSRSAAIFHLLG